MQEGTASPSKLTTTCPECKCTISHGRLRKHLLDRCPKVGKLPPGRRAERLLALGFSVTFHGTLSKCAGCGRPMAWLPVERNSNKGFEVDGLRHVIGPHVCIRTRSDSVRTWSGGLPSLGRRQR